MCASEIKALALYANKELATLKLGHFSFYCDENNIWVSKYRIIKWSELLSYCQWSDRVRPWAFWECIDQGL
jgi:hypothetical protein